MEKETETKSLDLLCEKVEQLVLGMEKMQFSEYLEMLRKPQRLLFVNFLVGVVRGLGMAVGFTLLGALVLYTLQRIVVLNLPGISSFIAQIVEMVRQQAVP